MRQKNSVKSEHPSLHYDGQSFITWVVLWVIQKPPLGENLNTEVEMVASQLQNISKDHRFPQQIKQKTELSHLSITGFI